MNRRPTPDPIGMMAAMLVVGLLFASCQPAHGGHTYAVRQQAVVPYVAPSLGYQPAVQYYIGQNVRQSAVDTSAFRASEEYQDYLEARGFRAGVLAARQVQADAPPASWQPRPEQPPADDLPLPPITPEAGPDAGRPEPTPAKPEAPPGAAPFANQFPTIVKTCAKCHTGDEPKGDRWLDGTADLRGVDASEKRDAIVRAILNEHMPPQGQPRLTDQTITEILFELYGEEEPQP